MRRPNAVVSGVAAGLCVATCAVGFALIGRPALDHLPIGYASRWHVPTSTVHNGLHYNLVKPVHCESRSSVEKDPWAAAHLMPLSSDNGFARFAPYSNTDDPVYLWLASKGRTCLVAYYQYEEIG